MLNDLSPGTFANLVTVRARNSRASSVGTNVINLSHGGMEEGSQHPMVKSAMHQAVALLLLTAALFLHHHLPHHEN